MKPSILFSLCSILLFTGCSEPASIELQVANPGQYDQAKAPVSISLAELGDLPAAFEIVDDSGVSIPYQLDDLNGDGTTDVLFTLVSITANSTSTLSIRAVETMPTFPTQTDAVIKVREQPDPESMQLGDDFERVDSYTEPFNFTQDNGLIYLEGPAWESNLVGYRFYFDDRNRFDIFGKSTEEPALGSITENYHALADWGADILKVGSSLGMASPALYENNTLELIERTGTNRVEVVTNGPLRSILRVYHPEWKTQNHTLNAVTELEIHAHHRYTELRLNVDGADKDLPFATGLIRHPDAAQFVELEIDNSKAGYTWGVQSDQGHTLGMAVMVPGEFEPSISDADPESHLIPFTSKNGAIRYRFLAAWELEPQSVRIEDEAAFRELVKEENVLMTQPVTITRLNP
ncbi:MAG: DUF4861 family protein [Bacteroidota bacterium]